ncbi:hypothetical protein KR044_010676 [Drosophila immigrans]|nr:hypothetical protein KR044_010676 [Drosophila immigrans]
MLAITKINLLLLLLLVFATPFLGSLTYLKPGISKANYIVDIIQNAIKERPTETLLVLKRRQQLNCTVKGLQLLGIPTIRKDELTTFEMKDSFNSDMISVVCMRELADSMLLTVLAKDLNRMRESRIIIWLQTMQPNPTAFLDVIRDQASSHNFLSLMVVHSNSLDVYRLQPFPSPSLERITDKRFVKTWQNFRGKTAVILADLLPPLSMLTTDRRTGEQKLVGFSDRLISEFAKKYNITLKLRMPLSEVNELEIIDIYGMTINGELDLPIRFFANSPRARLTQVEYTSVLRLGKILIVVPCGKEMCLSDVYTGLKTYSTIVLIAYFVFAIIETLFVAAFYRIIRRRYRFSYGNLLINMCAFRGVFGLSIPMTRYRSSLSLKQMVMIMSIFSLISSCLFNANLSTLLIKQPHHKQIDNFEQLRKSELEVMVDERSYNFVKWVIDEEFYESVMPNIKMVSSRQRSKMLYSLNTSYAYQTFSDMWMVLDIYQRRYGIKTMCRSPGLLLTDVPISGILMNNSVYSVALNEFMHLTYNMGLYHHWLRSANNRMIETFSKENAIENQEHVPLKINDLKWLWTLMALGYAVAGLVFVGEILTARWQRKQASREIIIRK